jgi:hypothetical protein
MTRLSITFRPPALLASFVLGAIAATGSLSLLNPPRPPALERVECVIRQSLDGAQRVGLIPLTGWCATKGARR